MPNGTLHKDEGATISKNADIRFIAINNGVDSNNQMDNDMTPFINIFNEFYAKDTSRKNRAVMKAKGESGKHICTNPPYGYLKDKEDKNKWVVDDVAAEVVKKIFKLCVNGYGASQIANELIKRKIPTPTEHLQSLGIKTPASKSEIKGNWQPRTVSDILEKQEYLGHTVNFKTSRKSYKSKKKILNPKDEWLVFENTHEAIIDQETFKIVQRIRDNKRVRNNLGEMPIYIKFAAKTGIMIKNILYAPVTENKKICVLLIRLRMFKLKVSFFMN